MPIRPISSCQCGNKAITIRNVERGWQYCCGNERMGTGCGARGPACMDPNASLDAWNKLMKINALREDIVGRQKINWSAHIYPLVAALEEAGFKGKGYEVARKEALALVDRIIKAETARDTAISEVLNQMEDRLGKATAAKAHEHWKKLVLDDNLPRGGLFLTRAELDVLLKRASDGGHYLGCDARGTPDAECTCGYNGCRVLAARLDKKDS